MLTFNNMDVNDRGYYYCTAIGNDAVSRVSVQTPALVDFARKCFYVVDHIEFNLSSKKI